MGDELILCGRDEVFILDPAQGAQKVWTWRASGQTSLPEGMWSKFGSVDECKPVRDGKQILITSSGSGVALIDRETGTVGFYATVPNAHSVDLLPNNRIAVAASHQEGASGDRLIVYNLDQPETEVHSVALPRGHGVVWDEARGVVWALSNEDIRVFELGKWDSETPSLKHQATIALPEGGGHELSPVVGTSLLAVSTSLRCYFFDRDNHTFLPHPDLANEKHVKCISHHPTTGRIAYVQGEGENWWAERAHFLHPDGVLHLPGERLYKARWNIV